MESDQLDAITGDVAHEFLHVIEVFKVVIKGKFAATLTTEDIHFATCTDNAQFAFAGFAAHVGISLAGTAEHGRGVVHALTLGCWV
jgi:hypothetical protein